MRALSIFPGGFTSDAAGWLLGDDDPLTPLAQLVDQSMLKVVDADAGTRFLMLETVREFSARLRDETDETELVTVRFLAWARNFGLAHHELPLDVELGASAALARSEQDNLMLALRYALDRNDGATVAATSAMLNGLWVIESNFTRMTAIAAEVAWTLSHYRPEPEFAEATRSATVLCAVTGLLIRGPSPVRALVTLRRLPPARTDTFTGALQLVFETITEAKEDDLSGLLALCQHDEPLLAGVANYVASYALEEANDIDGALTAARAILAAPAPTDLPWLSVSAHARIGELSLQREFVDEAVLHFGVVVSALAELGVRSTMARACWVLVLANLRRGAIDEAERWMHRAAGSDEERDEVARLPMASMAVRAEIALRRGEVDTGLRLWREAAQRLRGTGRDRRHDLTGLASWPLQIQADAVLAHARHERLELVPDLVDALPDTLTALVMSPLDGSAPSLVSFPVFGLLLLALAIVDIGVGERDRARSGVRLVALAERFGYPRAFQPSMPPSLVNRVAKEADRSAYADAVSSYANLNRNGLRAAAAKVLLERTVTGSGHA